MTEREEDILLRATLAGGRVATIFVSGLPPNRRTIERIIDHLNLLKSHGTGVDRLQCRECMIIVCPACVEDHRKGHVRP